MLSLVHFVCGYVASFRMRSTKVHESGFSLNYIELAIDLGTQSTIGIPDSALSALVFAVKIY
jgi:hypothetical protein